LYLGDPSPPRGRTSVPLLATGGVRGIREGLVREAGKVKPAMARAARAEGISHRKLLCGGGVP